jgi:hypothetical protein
MYTLINQHANTLVASLQTPTHVGAYVSLRADLGRLNVAADLAFQTRYRAFWQLNVARLSPAFISEYFRYLEQLKNGHAQTVEVVSRHLHATPTNARGTRSLQFSFASKLVHMIDPTQPIYDSLVEAFYFLPVPASSGLERLPQLLRSYTFLATEYRRIVTLKLLSPAISRFRSQVANNAVFTDEKITDSLIWAFVSLLRSGAVTYA